MTPHRTPAPRRRRRRAPRRRPLLPTALAVLAAVGAIGALAAWQSQDASMTTSARPSNSPSPQRSSPPSPEPSPESSPSATPTPTPTPSPSPPEIPKHGTGAYTTAPGTGQQAGKGTPLRYKVEIEKGIDLPLGDTADEVEQVLADRRGWTADGTSSFRRVSTGPTDFVVRIATPGTVDTACAEYGLDTHGDLNCSVAHKVMVNLERWLTGTQYYADDIPAYRALIVNHEVGHFLGHGHETCPAAGAPAPAMMQQITRTGGWGGR
ncbi:DUF3152 domain-containing protein [Streptomyces acidiscabies]|uniref:DUF3152 domain-containing protein n=1 Tax=Streptomyces acidiscabies TaxID=42234 RepID=UPI000A740198|nr:DUF3152 domain-containing protein [Streptomyces acidiscabies]